MSGTVQVLADQEEILKHSRGVLLLNILNIPVVISFLLCCHGEAFLNSFIKLDTLNKYAFVADYGGVITVLKLDPNNFQEVTTLRGHQSMKYLSTGMCES